MSVAHNVKVLSGEPGVYADIFIEEMKQQTGCSDSFLLEARPAIVKLFRDVAGEALENCLNDVRTLIVQQAETERLCQQAREEAQKLDALQAQMASDIQAIRHQVVEMRNSLQAAACTLLSKHQIPAKA